MTQNTILNKVEKALSMGALLCLALLIAGFSINEVLSIILGILALVYIITLRTPAIWPGKEGDSFGFDVFLGHVILRNVAAIAMAVSLAGIVILLLGLAFEGNRRLIIIGSTTTGIAILIHLILLIKGTKYITFVSPIFIRLLIMLAVALYFILLY